MSRPADSRFVLCLAKMSLVVLKSVAWALTGCLRGLGSSRGKGRAREIFYPSLYCCLDGPNHGLGLRSRGGFGPPFVIMDFWRLFLLFEIMKFIVAAPIL